MARFGTLVNVHLVCLSIILIFASVLLLTQNNPIQNSDSIKAIPAELPEDVPFVHLSKNFIKEKLWPELLRLTGTKIDATPPKLVFLEKDPSPIQINGELAWCSGQYLPGKQQIEIYRFSIYQDVKGLYQDSNMPFRLREMNIAIYMMIAHELLHHIYYMEGYLSSLEHHNKMKQDRSLSKICAFLSKELYSDRVSHLIIEKNLDKSTK